MALRPWGGAALILGLLLGACVPPPAPPPTGTAGPTPPGASPITLAPPADYRLGPGDEIAIDFLRTPEFSSRQIVRADGAISLVGLAPPDPVELIVSDLTIRELRRQLAQVYGRELKAPEIAITLKASAASVVYVTGEVARPGPVPFAGAMTAFQAIAAAEGVKSSARLNQILVIRPASGGRTTWRVVNLRGAFASGDFHDDVALAPRDVVYVPRSSIGNVDEFVDLYLRRTLPISPGFSIPVQ